MGKYNEFDQEITIANMDDADVENEKFLHELIHAIDANRALDLTEQQVTSLSHGLYQVLRDNKLYFGVDATQKKASAEK
jgi:hypothetical protein